MELARLKCAGGPADSLCSTTTDDQLAKFYGRPLEEAYPYVVLDARYEKVREDGVIRSRAVLVAIGINGDGRRCVPGVELANRESRSSWRDLLLGLKERGLRDVEFVVSDDHEGPKKAIGEVFAQAVWQRCYVHFLRNALDHLPRKAGDDCLMELRWIYERRTHVVRIFPNEASCLRLIRALAIEIHEDWIEATRYLNMDLLEEHKKLTRFDQLDAA